MGDTLLGQVANVMTCAAFFGALSLVTILTPSDEIIQDDTIIGKTQLFAGLASMLAHFQAVLMGLFLDGLIRKAPAVEHLIWLFRNQYLYYFLFLNAFIGGLVCNMLQVA